MPDGETSPTGWNSADKFAAVVETAARNEAALAEYGRERGRYPEPIRPWREACEQAHDWDRSQTQRWKAARAGDPKRLRRCIESKY